MPWRTNVCCTVLVFIAVAAIAPDAQGQAEQPHPLIAAATPAPPGADDIQPMYTSLGEFSLAAGNLFYTAAKGGQSDPAWNAQKIGPDLEKIQKSYVLGRDMSTATGKLLAQISTSSSPGSM